MNQLVDRIVKVSLVIMVLLSLFLSWKIWTKPANRSLGDKSKEATSEVVQSKKITDVYVPTKLFYHPDDERFLYTNKETMILDVSTKVTAFDFKHRQEMDEKSVNEAIYGKNTFNLVYPEEIPLSFYEEINNLELDIPSKMVDFKINRIIFSLNQDKVYFVNSRLTKGLEYDVSGDTDTISQLIKNEEKNSYLPVSLTPENIANVYYLEDEVELKTYSYIVATQSFTTFTKAFFNQPNDLYSNESENVNLSNNEGESITIQTDTGEVNYFGKLQTTKAHESNSLYFNTFQYVENLGNTLGALRFFNSKDTDIIYRNYIEGYPVFGRDMKGRLEVGIQNKTVFVRTNQETIQIPIPSTETVKLIKTQEVMNQLEEAGADMSLINDAQIAYQWQANAETKQAVDLVPTWYIKYEDTWYSLADLLSHFKQGGA